MPITVTLMGIAVVRTITIAVTAVARQTLFGVVRPHFLDVSDSADLGENERLVRRARDVEHTENRNRRGQAPQKHHSIARFKDVEIHGGARQEHRVEEEDRKSVQRILNLLLQLHLS